VQLQLGRAGASTNTGIIEASNGGVMNIGSVTINNTGGTIEAVGANSNVSLVGSLGSSGLTISGGTFTSSGGGVIYGGGGTTLDGTTEAVTNSGTFIVNDGGNNINVQGTLNNTGTIEILSTGGGVYFQMPGTESLTITGSGKVVMGDGTDNSYNNIPILGSNFGSSGVLTNQSTIEGTGFLGEYIQGFTNNGTIDANVPVGSSGLALFLTRITVFLNAGTIEATNGGEFGFDPNYGTGSFTNTGTLMVAAGSSMNLTNGDFTNLVSGTLSGGTYNVTGTLQLPGNITTNDAKITLTGLASQILNPSTTALAGFVTNGAMGSFGLAGGQIFTSAGTFTNQGVVTIGKGSTFTVGEGGLYVQNSGRTTVNGELTTSSTDDSGFEPAAISVKISRGSLFGSGGRVAASVSSSGTVTPGVSGTSPGKLTITGAYQQNAVGALDANIGGASSGQFGVLNVAGTATLGGTLNIALLNNFVPTVGATFEILAAKQVKGTFATVNGTAINSSEHFTVNYNSDNVTLTVVSGT
jgi:hypothetical protein